MRDWNSITHDRYYGSDTKKKTVGFGILDISRDIDSDMVRKRTFDMTFWMINQSLKMNVGSYRGFDEKVENLLEESINNGDDICIVQCQGMMSIRLLEIVHQSIDYFTNNPDKFVIGHIMAREGRYPGLHRQMLIVNLKVWDSLGRPPYLEQGFFCDRKRLYNNFQVSDSKVNAEYTPTTVFPLEGESEYSYTEDGANWIDLALRNNISIDNLSLEMRECKVFLYPYEETNLIEKVWYDLQNEKLVDSISNYSTRAWMRKLAYQEHIEKNRVYAFNTERLSAEGIRSPGPIDALFSAAAGFKPLAILRNNGFHENTVVHYFDWCEASLNFKKHLLETWDGVDFHKWLLEHDLKYNFSSTYRGNYEKFWRKEIINEFVSEQDFKELWDRYRVLKHEYHVIDIVTQPTDLFDLINKYSGNRALWTTNIWASMQLHWNIEPEKLEELWLDFENLIPPDLALFGQDYMARDMQKRVQLDNVSTHPRYISKNRYVTSEHEKKIY